MNDHYRELQVYVHKPMVNLLGEGIPNFFLQQFLNIYMVSDKIHKAFRINKTLDINKTQLNLLFSLFIKAMFANEIILPSEIPLRLLKKFSEAHNEVLPNFLQRLLDFLQSWPSLLEIGIGEDKRLSKKKQ